ncbi:MAG: bifunctional aspartate kinase/homoserine dehydrogenase I [Bacteroidales bacterium]|nr:bifunctional aspartate kinase/homoserine dehydrogenase I [Bacteroidales bacterium]
MKVLKFGGSSVAHAENIRKVVEIIKKESQNHRLAVVASAFGEVTDVLQTCGQLAAKGDLSYQKLLKDLEAQHFELARSLFSLQQQSIVVSEIKILLNELDDTCHGIYLLKELFPSSHDHLLSFGERLSSLVLSSFLNESGVYNILLDSRELIVTDANFGHAQVQFEITYERIRQQVEKTESNVFIPGFIAATSDGKPTTLGRGGSDYTAALVAAALDADSLEIWTDVDGVMTADPRRVSSAMPLEKLSYEEIMELSHFGAKVIFPPTIQPVMLKNISLYIKNTFRPEQPGTLICKNGNGTTLPVKGLSNIDNISLLTLTGGGMVGMSGVAGRLFSALSDRKVNVIFITQASSEHSITLAVTEDQVAVARQAIVAEFRDEKALSKVDEVLVESGLSVVALVGDHMKSSVGLSGKAFDALGKNGINIRAIAQGSTERNISIVISQNDVSKALNVLHETFFLSKYKKLHLFLVGVGNVGGALIRQIREQSEYLKAEHGLELRVVAMANSRKMWFGEKDLNLAEWKKDLSEAGETMDMDLFVEKMKDKNLRNAVFVDNTASRDVAGYYAEILQKSISVVASNKIAASNSYIQFRGLLKGALENNVKFLYETNVGAGLPVLKTIQDMLKSGDEIHQIQAVLSGSLNFIFNHFVGGTDFSDVVKEAMKQGYTEPDPRIDLSGEDVMRKILILSRECGLPLEFDQIQNKGFMPEALMKIEKTEDFLAQLPEYNKYFEELRKEAEQQQKKLRFVAELNNGKASVGLQQVSSDQPYYQLDGKDNIVLIYSRRYNEQPLVIKGAGAGASVTASGVFADIISLANQ